MFLLTEMNKEQFAFFIREETSKEKMKILDFGYISPTVEGWWQHENKSSNCSLLKNKLIYLLMNKLSREHIKLFENVGFANSNIAAVCIKNIFKKDSPKLSLIVHEALSDLFHITDIKYDYEEHKTLFLKPSAVQYKNWGGGYGEITPHSDDLYEYLNIDYLALTTCRDQTKTATRCFFPKNILKEFSDDELYRLKDIKATFKSGKNVSILLERTRNILDYSKKYGFRFFLDFRVDNITEQRMTACDPNDQILLDKMQNILESCPYEISFPETGTFLIIANYKVLHARAQMNLDRVMANSFSRTANLMSTPRLLYRSKGPRREYLTI